MISILISSSYGKEIEIPRTTFDKGKYYLLEKRQKNGILITVHKRIGPSGTGYTKCEINCKAKKIREIGYSEVSEKDIPNNPTNWSQIVEGSSKSDLFNFVCNQ